MEFGMGAAQKTGLQCVPKHGDIRVSAGQCTGKTGVAALTQEPLVEAQRTIVADAYGLVRSAIEGHRPGEVERDFALVAQGESRCTAGARIIEQEGCRLLGVGLRERGLRDKKNKGRQNKSLALEHSLHSVLGLRRFGRFRAHPPQVIIVQ